MYFCHNHSLNAEKNDHYAGILLDAPTIALCPKLCRQACRHNVSNPTRRECYVFLRTIGTGHCPLSLYRLFIASKNMSSQRTTFGSEKIKLSILTLRYFLSYLEVGWFFRNLKVNLSNNRNWQVGSLLRVWQDFCPQLSKAKEDVTQNSVMVDEINKGNIEWCIISLLIFEKDVIS